MKLSSGSGRSRSLRCSAINRFPLARRSMSVAMSASVATAKRGSTELRLCRGKSQYRIGVSETARKGRASEHDSALKLCNKRCNLWSSLVDTNSFPFKPVKHEINSQDSQKPFSAEKFLTSHRLTHSFRDYISPGFSRRHVNSTPADFSHSDERTLAIPTFRRSRNFSQASEKSKTDCGVEETFVIPFLAVRSERLVSQTPVENFHSQEEELKNFKFEFLKVCESWAKVSNYQSISTVLKKLFPAFTTAFN